MVVLVTVKNEEDQIKNEGARVVTTFLRIYNNWGEANSFSHIIVLYHVYHSKIYLRNVFNFPILLCCTMFIMA